MPDPCFARVLSRIGGDLQGLGWGRGMFDAEGVDFVAKSVCCQPLAPSDEYNDGKAVSSVPRHMRFQQLA